MTDEHLDALDRSLAKWPPLAGRPVRPRDSAALILVDRGDPRTPRILFGRRNPQLRFLPGKFVFPGGAVDPGDRRIAAAGALAPACAARLAAGARRAFRDRVQVLALAAIREMAEETGLYLGVPSGPGKSARCWPDFEALGLAPSLEGISYVARAITPPRAPRRFDARFFAADASMIAARTSGAVGPDRELVELVWASLEEAENLDLHLMTRAVLSAVGQRLTRDAQSATSVPFFRVRHGRFVRELIET